MNSGKKSGTRTWSTNALSTMHMNVVKNPGQIAVICEDRQLTWEELWRRSNQLANGLRSLGLLNSERVLVFMPNCFEYPEIVLGIAKSGLIGTLGNYRLTADEIVYQIDNSGASAVFVKEDQLPTISSILDRVPRLKHVILVAEETVDNVISYEKLLASSSADEPEVQILPEDIHLLMYTSGTTGKPKGVARTHSQNYHLAVSMCIEFGFNKDAVQLIVAPLYAAASAGFMYSSFLSGGTVVIVPAFIPEMVLQTINKYHPSWMFMVPIMFDWLLTLPQEAMEKYDLSSLKTIIACGAPLHNHTMRRMVDSFKSAMVFNSLGCSELGFVTAVNHEDWFDRHKEGSIGKAVLDMELKVADSEGKEVKPGEVGILYGRGPNTFERYWENEEGTREAFLDHEWATVGDMARQDEDGYIYLVDRVQDVIITGGTNVYPVEVENVLLQMEGIADAAVIGVPDEKWGEAVKGMIVLKDGAQLTEEEIIQFCRQKLAGFKIPKSVDFIDQVPRSMIGKTLRKELRKKFWADKDTLI